MIGAYLGGGQRGYREAGLSCLMTDMRRLRILSMDDLKAYNSQELSTWAKASKVVMPPHTVKRLVALNESSSLEPSPPPMGMLRPSLNPS